MAGGTQYSDDAKDLIRDRVAVSEVVGRHVALTKKGSEFTGLCPFHNDTNPSFSVVDDKQFFHCFSCGAHGDVFDFVQKIEGLTFPETLAKLADMAGITASDQPASPPKPKPAAAPKVRKPITYKDRDWRMLEPPAGTPLPDVDGESYLYCTATGGPLMIIERSPDKRFTPWIFAETVDGAQRQWIPRHPLARERPLYNLDRIAQSNRTVLIVEGEKAADAAQANLTMPVTTSSGGSSAGKSADWSPLKGRKVLIWPDADEPGIKHQETIAPILAKLGCTIQVVDTTDLPDTYDAADLIEESGFDIKIFLTDRVRDWLPPGERPTLETGMEVPPQWEPADDPIHNADGHPGENPNDLKFWAPRILGVSNGCVAGIPYNGTEIKLIPDEKLSKSTLLTLARHDMYWGMTNPGPIRNGENTVDWDTAASDVMDTARAMGHISFENVRRRGAWREPDGSMLFNSGSHLHDISYLDDGEPRNAPIPLSRHRGYYAYIGGPDLSGFVAPHGEGISNGEGRKIVDILKEVTWVMPMSIYLLAGWIFAAPICGVAFWRPHIWITGPHGSGKSTVLQEIIIPLLNNMVRAFEGGSTAAGVRQDLKSDALAVIYDEAESERNRGQFKSTMEQILELARISSSSNSAAIVKGTASQTSAMSFECNSMFCFSSIVVDVESAADDSRISRFEIAKNPSPDSEDHFLRFRQMIHETITPDFCNRFLRRAMDQAPFLRRNAEIFAEILSRILQDRRPADQLSTMIAGYFGLTVGGMVSREEAEKFCNRMPWAESVSHEKEYDESRALWAILNFGVRVETGQTHKTMPLRVVMSIATGDELDSDLRPQAAREILRSWDIRYLTTHEAKQFGAGDEGFLIDPNGTAVKTALSQTRYVNAAKNMMIRRGGIETKPVRVGQGKIAKTVRAVFLPVDVIVNGGDNGDQG